MSDTPAKSEPKPSLSQRLTALPRRFARQSLAARTAWLVALVLPLIVVVAWSIFLLDPTSVPWRHAMTPGRVLSVVALLVLIPAVVYQTLRLWLDGDASPFADIDYAWNQGLRTLENNGIDIRNTPLFVVLGAPSAELEQTLVTAAGLTLRVRETPAGPAALHWYANPDGIYLFCTDAGWTGALAAHTASLLATSGGRKSPDDSALSPAPLDDVTHNLAPDSEQPHREAHAARSGSGLDTPSQLDPVAPTLPPVAAPSGKTLHGTVSIDPQLAAQILAASSPAPSSNTTTTRSAANDPRQQRGTVMLQKPVDVSRSTSSEPEVEPWRRTTTQPSLLTAQTSAQQLDRLNYVCRLLVGVRRPLCPLNGVLTLVDLRSILGGRRESDELQRALKYDLATIHRATQLRFPVNALVFGLESEPGFRELVRRVGRQRASQQRFGRGFDPRSPATADQLAALSEHVCGSFEDWVYTLFREEGSLQRPGNTRLYGLLCKVRTMLKYRLTDMLVGGFAYDPHEDILSEPLLFSGCYLAATGTSEDRQAFVRSVFDKLQDDAENIEWTPTALAHEQRFAWLLYSAAAVAAVEVVTFASLWFLRR